MPSDHPVRIVTTLHGTDTTLLGRDPGYGPAIRHALERSDAITTVSEFLRRETINHLGVRRPIEVIHNFFEPGTPGRSRAEVRRELGVGDEALILHISNLRPVKRIDAVMEVFRRIRAEVPANLLLVGDGPELATAYRLARELDVASFVHVLGAQEEVIPLLSIADVFLLPSAQESFGLAALEARARWEQTHERVWPRSLDCEYSIAVWAYRAARRGDYDNFGKQVNDALNGVLWADDRQIFKGVCERIPFGRRPLFIGRGNDH